MVHVQKYGIRVALLVVLLPLSAAGCGGSSSTSDQSAAKASAEAIASAIGQTPPVSSADDGADAGAVSAKDICDALEKVAPTLAGKGEIENMATLTFTIANLYDEKKALSQLSGSKVDDMAQATCPDTRATVLKAAGVSSFAAL